MPSNPCRLCGIQFTPEHRQVCPARKVQCNLCKKIGHYSKVRRSAKLLWHSQQIISQQNNPQTRRVRHISETTTTHSFSSPEHDIHTQPTDKTIEPENTFLIQEIFGNWTTLTFVKTESFNTQTSAKCSPKLSDEIWICTTTNNTGTDWIADTGSLRSLLNKEEALKKYATA